MEPTKRLLKEAERLSRFGKQDQRPVDQHPVPDFFNQREFVAKWNSIPDKLAFKIGEVAELVRVKQYVLRYWETEFEELKPKKGPNNQRMYHRKNIETALMIQHLLHIERFSIEGARKFMRKRKEDQRRQKREESHKKSSEHLLLAARALQDRIHQLRLRVDSYFRLDV